MADHPLRPATDQSLGRPLPHQLANPTRAPPAAINLSPVSPFRGPPGVCGISRSFPRLSPTTGQVPTRYSPVRHSLGTEAPRAFDLHVLGMPPAFVLSQDQTLKFIPGPSVLTRTPWSYHAPRNAGPSGRTHIRASKTLANAPASGNPRRRPRIPSLPYNLNQQSPRPSDHNRPCDQPPPTTAGPRLYPHPQPPSTPLITQNLTRRPIPHRLKHRTRLRPARRRNRG